MKKLFRNIGCFLAPAILGVSAQAAGPDSLPYALGTSPDVIERDVRNHNTSIYNHYLADQDLYLRTGPEVFFICAQTTDMRTADGSAYRLEYFTEAGIIPQSIRAHFSRCADAGRRGDVQRMYEDMQTRNAISIANLRMS